MAAAIHIRALGGRLALQVVPGHGDTVVGFSRILHVAVALVPSDAGICGPSGLTPFHNVFRLRVGNCLFSFE